MVLPDDETANHRGVACERPRGLESVEALCAADEVYCWHSCIALAEAPDENGAACPLERAECRSLDPDNHVCSDDEHDCHLTCRSGLLPDPDAFCNPRVALDMYMGGFTTQRSGQGCLVLLHPGMVLSSRGLFVLGCLFTFAFGVATEFLLRLRRQHRQQRKRVRRRSYNLEQIGLHLLNLVFGYVVMLFVMTYSVEMFATSILGLVAGHVLFNRDAEGDT